MVLGKRTRLLSQIATKTAGDCYYKNRERSLSKNGTITASDPNRRRRATITANAPYHQTLRNKTKKETDPDNKKRSEESEQAREKDRETDRQRKRDRLTGRQRDRQTDKQTNRQRKRDRQTDTDRGERHT